MMVFNVKMKSRCDSTSSGGRVSCVVMRPKNSAWYLYQHASAGLFVYQTHSDADLTGTIYTSGLFLIQITPRRRTQIVRVWVAFASFPFTPLNVTDKRSPEPEVRGDRWARGHKAGPASGLIADTCNLTCFPISPSTCH